MHSKITKDPKTGSFVNPGMNQRNLEMLESVTITPALNLGDDNCVIWGQNAVVADYLKWYVQLVIIYPLHQGRTPTRPRPPYRLLDLHLFDPNRRNLNPMVPVPTTMTVDNTFDFKAYDY
eukprot:COSAG01_NODE_7325_length_3250_cov_128.583624_2_plen_120_part_00